VLFSCAVKVAVQVEIARWTIATGTPALQGFNRVPPMIWKLSWVNWVYFILFLSKILQVGGIVGGVAIAFQIMFPFLALELWVGVVVVATIALLFSNAYGWIEKGAFYLVVIFSVITVMIAFGLPLTPFAYTGAEIASGLTFAIPAGTLAVVLGMFGITGVGADEITIYNYWCLEKGYARWTGPRENSQAWLDRAQGWLAVMYKDVLVSLVIYTFATMAFFIMGASVLWRQGLKVAGNEMIIVMSRTYTDTLGPWASTLFLVGAIAVLFSTLWAAVPSNARAYTNWMSLIKPEIWSNPSTRMKFMKGWTVALPIIWAIAYLAVKSPVLMVQIGGIMTGVFLVAVVVAAWYLRNTETDKRLWGGSLFNLLLIVSSIAIGFLGVYSILTVFGIKLA
jgi:Mn2+/Fe2+ NRAMP family transporter